MTVVNKRSHDCYDHFELQKADIRPFKCGGCKMYGFGAKFVCELCDKNIHKYCRYPEDTITPDLLKFSTFEFTEVVPVTITEMRKEYKHCIACGKDVLGFSYHCESENLHLHPSCYKLESKLLMDDFIFDLQRAKISTECVLCDVDRKSSLDCWTYISSCKNYHIHVNCFIEKLQSVCLKQSQFAFEKFRSSTKDEVSDGLIVWKPQNGNGDRAMRKVDVSGNSMTIFGSIGEFFKFLYNKIIDCVRYASEKVINFVKNTRETVFEAVMKFFYKIARSWVIGNPVLKY